MSRSRLALPRSENETEQFLRFEILVRVTSQHFRRLLLLETLVRIWTKVWSEPLGHPSICVTVESGE